MTTKAEALKALGRFMKRYGFMDDENASDMASIRDFINSAHEWKPMSSAPESGDVILVYRPDAGVFTAHYVEDDAHFSNYMNPPEGDYYWFSTCGDDLTNDMPTHWMPLPNPPITGETK